MELLWECMIISLQGMLGTVLWAFIIAFMLAVIGGSFGLLSNFNYKKKPKETQWEWDGINKPLRKLKGDKKKDE